MHGAEVEVALTQFKQSTGLTWKSTDYESQCASWLKKHRDYGETFPEWKLYESARSVYKLLNKSGMLEDFKRHMECFCDFLCPRLNASVALQCIQHVLNAVAVSLYDGTDTEDFFLFPTKKRHATATAHSWSGDRIVRTCGC